jgi:hypothetical protein
MKCRLLPHPEAPPSSIHAVEVDLLIDRGDDIVLRFRVTGDDILLPEWSSPERADELWTTTCFELFLRDPASGAYFEFNFSPSSKWAAYAFDRYREGRREMRLSLDLQVFLDPEREPEDGDADFVLEADVDLSDIPNVPLRMSVCAIIEEMSGAKSYWALAHPSGPPDFHHPDCFTLELPAAKAP